MPDLNENAKIIADILKNTDSDDRGYLLLQVSRKLRKVNLDYVAHLIKKIACEYGIFMRGEDGE